VSARAEAETRSDGGGFARAGRHADACAGGAGPAWRGGGPGGEGEEAGRAGLRGEERERAAQLRF